MLSGYIISDQHLYAELGEFLFKKEKKRNTDYCFVSISSVLDHWKTGSRDQGRRVVELPSKRFFPPFGGFYSSSVLLNSVKCGVRRPLPFLARLSTTLDGSNGVKSSFFSTVPSFNLLLAVRSALISIHHRLHCYSIVRVSVLRKTTFSSVRDKIETNEE